MFGDEGSQHRLQLKAERKGILRTKTGDFRDPMAMDTEARLMKADRDRHWRGISMTC